MDRALRAHSSSLKTEAERLLAEKYGRCTWSPSWEHLHVQSRIGPRIEARGAREHAILEAWSVEILGGPEPGKGGGVETGSIYCTMADQVRLRPDLAEQTFAFRGGE